MGWNIALLNQISCLSDEEIARIKEKLGAKWVLQIARTECL